MCAWLHFLSPPKSHIHWPPTYLLGTVLRDLWETVSQVTIFSLPGIKISISFFDWLLITFLSTPIKWPTFSVAYGPFGGPLLWRFVQFFYSLFSLGLPVFLLFQLTCRSSLSILDVNPFSDICTVNALPFHSHNGVFWRIELLNFNMMPLIIFSSIVITYVLFKFFFLVQYHQNLTLFISLQALFFNLSQRDVKFIRNWVLWVVFKSISSPMQVAWEPRTVCCTELSPPHCPTEVLLF